MTRRRFARRTFGATEVQLTSVLDVMTIILVFLLHSFATEPPVVMPDADLVLPVASGGDVPRVAVDIVATRAEVRFDGRVLVTLEPFEDPTTRRPSVRIPPTALADGVITPLLDALRAKAPEGGRGRVQLQCDKRLPYAVVRDLMVTAERANFGEFRFVVVKGG